MTAASAQDRTTAPALSAAPDPAAFREPPADTRPNTLYFWMNGNVTREGIDADLTAMRDIGLGGTLMFDGSNDVPKGPVNYIRPHWLALLTHMAATAQDLGPIFWLHHTPPCTIPGGHRGPTAH